MKQFLLAFWEVAEVILIAVVTVFCQDFLMQPFLVSGPVWSQFFHGELSLIDEVTYRLRVRKEARW